MKNPRPQDMSPPGTPCLEMFCQGEAWARGRCRGHYVPWDGSTRQSRLPSDWEARRRLVFKRKGRVCLVCNDREATEIDHIAPGDNHATWNLQPICNPCHRIKSSKEGAAARRRKSEGRNPNPLRGGQRF